MKVFNEIGIEDFEAWAGAVATKDKILEAGKAEEFDKYIEEMYTDGIGETELNDELWFNAEEIFEALGIEDNEEEEE